MILGRKVVFLTMLAPVLIGALGWAGVRSSALMASQTAPALPLPNAPRPAFFGNGKGFAILSAVAAQPVFPGGAYVYQLNANRWSLDLLAHTKKSGFGYVRLIATIMPLMSDDPAARQRALAWVGDQVDAANAAGLGVSVSLGFWPGAGVPDPDKGVIDRESRARVIRAEVEMAKFLAEKKSQAIGLEFISEPQCKPETGPDSWPPIQLEMWKEVRRVAPRLPLVLTACRARVDAVLKMDASPYRGDPNVIWSFHYYDFFEGQEWAKLKNVPFPARPELANSDAAMRAMIPAAAIKANSHVVREVQDYLKNDHGEATIRDKIASIADWARRNGIPASHVSLNEWAPIFTNRPENEAIRPDTLRYIQAVRREAERQGFNWAYWSLEPNDLNYDPTTHFFRRDTQVAFGLTPSS